MQTYIIYISTRPFAVGVHLGFSHFSDLPLVIRKLKMSAISGDGGVNKDLRELKSSFQFLQKDIEDLNPLTKQMTKIEKEIGEVQTQVDYHCNKMEYFENQPLGPSPLLLPSRFPVQSPPPHPDTLCRRL